MYMRSRRAFTLVEVCVCLLIFMILALSITGSLVYAHKSLELNKQRLAAMNLCRKYMESIMNHSNVPRGVQQVRLLDSDEYDAKVKIEYYGLVGAGLTDLVGYGDSDAGRVDWSFAKMGPSLDEPTYVRVTVEWNSAGVLHRNHSYSTQAVVTKGLI